MSMVAPLPASIGEIVQTARRRTADERRAMRAEVESRAMSAAGELELPNLADRLPSVDLGEMETTLVARRPGFEIEPLQQLVDRTSLGSNRFELAAAESLGYQGYLDYQSKFEGIDDGPLEAIIAQYLPATQMSILETYINYQDEPFQPAIELQVAYILRAIYTPRQLFQRMVVFWTDHFNIDLFTDVQMFFKPTDQREVIRRHALGKFEDLLMASAKSPAMLLYLDNFANSKDHANENYGREVMELHTLGVDGGYTEADVKEVARCFTGWTIGDLGEFAFNWQDHDFGEKIVLGTVIPANGGVEDGEAVIRLLAGHDSTATHIATKIARHLVGYEPPRALVRRLAQVYRNTRGNIRRMVRVALEEVNVEQHTPKLKRPFHLLTSAVRGSFAEITNLGQYYERLWRAGHLPFTWNPPNGFPDADGYWAGGVLARWNDMSEMLDPERGFARAELSFFGSDLDPSDLARRIDFLFFNRTLSRRTFDRLRTFLQAGVTEARVQEAIGLALSSPEFQLY